MQFRPLWILTFAIALTPQLTTQVLAESRINRIKIEYVLPKTEDQHVYNLMKARRVLERVQNIFSPVRLPIDLWVKMKSCGMINTWYRRRGDHAVVTICYDYVSQVLAKVPEDTTPMGITATDAIEGQLFYVTFHEMGHALFDLLDVPIFGRPEDAADEFSTYAMLAFGKEDARRLIMGAAYSYRQIMELPEMTIKMKMFSDVHGSSAQRYYNMLCLAYGARPGVFSDVVERGLLPEQRAKDCNYEYRELAYAFKRLIFPHCDSALVKKVLHTEWLPPEPGEKPLR